MSGRAVSELRKRLILGEEIPATLETIRMAIDERKDVRSGHADWGLLCEQAGLMSLAFSEFQLALRDDPQDAVALAHLAQHYHERGDAERAVSLLQRLLEDAPARVEWLSELVEIFVQEGALPRARAAIERAEAHDLAPAEAAKLRAKLGRPPVTGTESRAEDPELTPTDADCMRFCTLFAGREGVYARQWARPNADSGYTPVREPLTPAVVRNHLLGTFTVGAYPVRLDNTATFFALDLDIDKAALHRARGDSAFASTLRSTLRQEGPRLMRDFEQLGLPALFENSGYKGRHYWVFLDEPETSRTLHLLGRLILAWQAPRLASGLHLEAFPKQARIRDGGLGNLIKLPLGIHRRTGYRSQILNEDGQPVTDPLGTLREIQRVPRTALYEAVDRLKSLAPRRDKPRKRPRRRDASPSSEDRLDRARGRRVDAPQAPAPPPDWTEADFETHAGVRHLLACCPVLARLKDHVDKHRRLTHEEQLVLIHTLGHLKGGPQAVNYLLGKCVDVGPEKYMKDRLKGNPVSCPSIRKKIPSHTRQVACNCGFEFAADRYPSPVLHLLTLPEGKPAGKPDAGVEKIEHLARRYGVLERRRAEIQEEWAELRDRLVLTLRTAPDRSVAIDDGRYLLIEQEGVEELVWTKGEPASAESC